MDIEADFTVLATEDLRYPVDRFDRVSMALHWITVALVAVQLGTAFLLHRGGDGGRALLGLHRSTGVVILAVVAWRLVWRARFAYRPPFPVRMPTPQRWAARANEDGLYALLLLQPATGLGDALFRGRPFALFGLQVPALAQPHKALFHALAGLHEVGAWALIALIGLHVAAAALHGLVLRDGVLRRMTPRPRR